MQRRRRAEVQVPYEVHNGLYQAGELTCMLVLMGVFFLFTEFGRQDLWPEKQKQERQSPAVRGPAERLAWHLFNNCVLSPLCLVPSSVACC